MGFLAFSVVCSVLVSVLLKIARHRHIDLIVAITVNYAVCIVATYILLNPTLDSTLISSGVMIFGALGILLPSVFLVMGKAVQSAGIVKSDTAQRLALIIPIIASFTLFGENLTPQKTTALILVFLAMACLLYKKSNKTDDNNRPKTTNEYALFWLLGVFVGYGVIDVLLKQLSKMGSATASNLLISFGIALVVMSGVLLVKKIKPNRTSLLGGVVLGCLNFANIYTYIHAHKAMSDTPTIVFAGMNMGVIVLGTLVGLIAFKEKISLINGLGIVLALGAIAGLYLV